MDGSKPILTTYSQTPNLQTIMKKGTYTELFSSGVAKGGFGYLSSRDFAMISESATQFSSNFTTGTLPSGLIFVNLRSNDKD